MGKKTILDEVKKGKVLVSDGAWGTFLQKKGLKAGECPELWNINKPNEVFDIAKSYIDVGVDMIESNSFGGTKYKLEHFGLSGKVSEINEAASKISKKAAGSDKFVIASIGPTGKMLITGDVTEEEMYDAFKDQAVALEKGGADALCIETMSAIDEACIAIKAALENTKCEIICTFTFELTSHGEYRTMMGLKPVEAAKEAIKTGSQIIGANCGNGLERMIQIVKEMRTVTKETPILVHANAGLPKNVNGVDVFPETPENMASMIPDLIKAGANIIGGCCGTTPEHIKEMKKAVELFAKK